MTILASFLSLLIAWFSITKLQLSFKRVMILVMWPAPFFTFIMWLSQEGGSLIDIGKVLLVVLTGLFVTALPYLIIFSLLLEIVYKKNLIKSNFWFLFYAGFIGMGTFIIGTYGISKGSFLGVVMFVLHFCIAFLVYVLPGELNKRKKKS